MQNDTDPVDRALASLAGRTWPGSHENAQLENKLMRSFNTNSTTSFAARHRVLLSAIVLLLVVGVGFAAAGGIELIRSWLVTTSINGEVVDVQEVVPNEDGSASFTIQVPDIEGDTAEIGMSIEGEGYDPGGYKTLNIALDGGEVPGEAHVTITTQPEEDDE